MGSPLRRYLYFDLGFFDACNLRCTYCRSELVKDSRAFSVSDLETQVRAFKRSFQAAVVKLSGYGEVTMWRDLPQALELLASEFPVVQIISNGTFDEKTRKLLLSFPSVSPNLTIDGHTLELNQLRVGGSRRLHDRILENLRILLAEGRRVEVNCVLHCTNSDGLLDFCEYLARYPDRSVMLFPFPAKRFALAPTAADELAPPGGRLIEAISAAASRYPQLLPPRPYCDRLTSFLQAGDQAKRCHVHWANMGSGSRNERLHCPNYGEDLTYGPMLESLTTQRDSVLLQETQHLRLGKVGPNCSGCFNHFDVINAYLEGTMELESLLSIPSLCFPNVRDIAMSVRTDFVNAYRHVAHDYSVLSPR